jgi:hypothetical protein
LEENTDWKKELGVKVVQVCVCESLPCVLAVCIEEYIGQRSTERERKRENPVQQPMLH